MDDTTNYGTSGDVPVPSFPDRLGDASETADGDRGPIAEKDPVSTSIAGRVRQRLTGALDDRKGTAADRVEQLAQSVKRSSEQFEGQQDWIASAIGRGAEELSAFAGTLRDKDLGDLTVDVGRFAERRPALFLAAAGTAGFVLARLGKLVAADLSRADLPTMPEIAHGR